MSDITFEDEVDAATAILRKMLEDFNEGKESWGLLKCMFDGKPALALGYLCQEDAATTIMPLFIFLTNDLTGRVTPPPDVEVSISSGTISEILEDALEKKVIN